jgi:leucine-rich repeat protein SHOC2
MDNEIFLDNNQLESLQKSFYRLNNLERLMLCENQLQSLPEWLDRLIDLQQLELGSNQLKILPESLEQLEQLANITYLKLSCNQLKILPEWIDRLTNLLQLNLGCNQLENLPDSIGKLSNLEFLDICNNQLTDLPGSIDKLANLISLNLERNRLKNLPASLCKLTKLRYIELSGNPLTDLSILQSLNKLKIVNFFDVKLPRRYWTKLSEWQSQWLLDEENAKVRRVLIQQIGYEWICQDLDAIIVDNWREYSLLKIEDFEIFSEEEQEKREPLILLKMTCPSTAHIHILRVAPEMTSAEAAITWVNHGIHPDRFSIQT